LNAAAAGGFVLVKRLFDDDAFHVLAGEKTQSDSRYGYGYAYQSSKNFHENLPGLAGHHFPVRFLE